MTSTPLRPRWPRALTATSNKSASNRVRTMMLMGSAFSICKINVFTLTGWIEDCPSRSLDVHKNDKATKPFSFSLSRSVTRLSNFWKFLGNHFAYKSSPKIVLTFGIFWYRSIDLKTAVFRPLLKKLGNLFNPASGHTALSRDFCRFKTYIFVHFLLLLLPMQTRRCWKPEPTIIIITFCQKMRIPPVGQCLY